MKLKMMTVIRENFAIGPMMRNRMPLLEQPSIEAASSFYFPRISKKPWAERTELVLLSAQGIHGVIVCYCPVIQFIGSSGFALP